MEKQTWKRWIKRGQTHFCPGCLYGTILNYLACALEKQGIEPQQLAAVSGIGCAAWISDRYLQADAMHTTHGRPIAFAAGIKMANPEQKVIVISGDGDLTSIGTNHLVHAIRRNLDITVFCVNNFVYGMTGGQAGSTTPLNAVTSTTPEGNLGQPLDLIQVMLALGCNFTARYPVLSKNPRVVIRTMQKALEYQGLSFVELVAPCATHFNRKNKIPSAKKLNAYLEERYISKAKAKKLSAEDKKNKIIYGNFDSLNDYKDAGR